MATLAARITALAQSVGADIKALRSSVTGKAASGANTDITSITGSAAKLTTARSIAASGDATGSASFDGSADVSIPLTLASSGVTAGTYPVLTVDAKGRATAGRALQAGDIPAHSAALITSGVLGIARVPVLGTVSQSGGVPTGAIIESGSNANGRYVRYANGTQICWSTSAKASCNIAVTAGYLSSSVSLNWAASFVEAPTVSLGVSGAYGYSLFAGTDSSPTTSGFPSLYLLCPTANTNAAYGYITATAIGRWF